MRACDSCISGIINARQEVDKVDCDVIKCFHIKVTFKVVPISLPFNNSEEVLNHLIAGGPCSREKGVLAARREAALHREDLADCHEKLQKVNGDDGLLGHYSLTDLLKKLHSQRLILQWASRELQAFNSPS